MEYCPKCGKSLNAKDVFCVNCGFKIIDKKSITSDSVSKKDTNSMSKEQKGKFTKEGRKIISGGPKPIQKYKAPSNVQKPKKNKLLGYIKKTVLTILALFIVIFFLILILPEDNDTEKSTIVKEDATEIENKETVNSKETVISTIKEDEYEEKLLDVNDVNTADKYRIGIGVEPDQYKAFEIYKKLAEKGDLIAMVELSNYYEQGIWVRKDMKKAKELLQQAAEKGSLPAKWQLEFLESEN